ncbi:hypothetical protein AM1_5777 [Acaryochloris marina MBIC11017]|uniref:Uncharacterized protein n=1 Tax=Acaryochloris marina (strain MBIC 11017) TaxID=329726 RepID=B0BZH7_ACAM1|nr:hypothetical protein AM1_5777 [Acaryochloris marina MBIC11017]
MEDILTPVQDKPIFEPLLRKNADFSLRKNKDFSLSPTQVILY